MFKKKILILVLIVNLFGLVFLGKPVKASYWGEGWGVFAADKAWEEAINAFKGAMLTSLKKQANNLLRDRIRVLLTGNGRPLIITDYDDYIFGGARREGIAYSKDFFRTLNKGVSDTTSAIYDDVEDALLSPESAVSTIDQYVQGGLDNLFDEDFGGGVQALMAVGTNPMNHPLGVYQRAEEIKNSRTQMAEKRAEVEAIAGSGFMSQTDKENNLINLPGSVLASLTAKTEAAYIDMVNMAENIPEVIGTVAANMLSKTIEAGVAEVTNPIDNKLRSFHDDVEGGVKTVQDEIYDGFGVYD